MLEGGHPLAQLLRGAVPAADEARPDALLREVRQLPVDRLVEDLHQRVDLGRRPEPVLGRERVHRQRLDAEVDRRFDGAAERPRALAMPCFDRQAARLRPASVSVEDDRHRPWNLPRLEPGRVRRQICLRNRKRREWILRPRSRGTGAQRRQEREPDQDRGQHLEQPPPPRRAGRRPRPAGRLAPYSTSSIIWETTAADRPADEEPEARA